MSKVEAARKIFSENTGLTRQQMIQKFVKEADCTPFGASSYYAKFKKEGVAPSVKAELPEMAKKDSKAAPKVETKSDRKTLVRPDKVVNGVRTSYPQHEFEPVVNEPYDIASIDFEKIYGGK